ncbi:hypothetical protein AGIG_G4575 [Arapaima gigas]
MRPPDPLKRNGATFSLLGRDNVGYRFQVPAAEVAPYVSLRGQRILGTLESTTETLVPPERKQLRRRFPLKKAPYEKPVFCWPCISSRGSDAAEAISSPNKDVSRRPPWPDGISRILAAEL